MRLLVLCGSSGAGKTTMKDGLLGEFPEKFGFSVSHTTRSQRSSEEDGKDYHFTDLSRMQKMIDDGEFVETIEFDGNKYGTSKTALNEVLNSGKICILDIEMHGVQQLKETANFPALYVFVKAPSMEELERRLRARGTETDESLCYRLNKAKAELEYGEQEGVFDMVLVNDDRVAAYGRLRDFLLSKLDQEYQV